MSSTSTIDHILTNELRSSLVTRLRKLEPWMQVSVVHEMVDRCGELLDNEFRRQQPAIAAAKKRSSFLNLPPELRTRIYELLLIPRNPLDGIELDISLIDPRSLTHPLAIHIGVDAGSTYIQDREALWQHQQGQSRSAGWALQPALTKICRQVRKETLPIYYGNEFLVDVDDRLAKGPIRINKICFPVALRWLSAIGPENRKLLKTISFQGGTLNYRWVSARRFLAVMEKEGIHDLPEGVVRSFHLDTIVNQFGRAETKWIEASQEMDELHSHFADRPEAL